MNIAIPTFGSRVSPRFDLAASLLVVKVQGQAVLDRGEEPMDHLYGWRRIGLLRRRNVGLVLCGGIRRCDYFAIVDAGIDVCAGLMGEVEDVLQAFLRGDIHTKARGGMFMAAIRKRGRRRLRHRGAPGVYAGRTNKRTETQEPGR